MCMLCVIPPNVIPSRDKLENSALNNPHGFGYAIAIPSEARIHTFRTMNADQCINQFFEDRFKYMDGYAIWHARYATHGSTTLDNCHPYRVGSDEQTYLAHNGILSVIENPQEKRSDTRIFAEDLLPTIGGVASLDNPQVWNMLEDFTTGSKVAVLTVNPNARHQLYLLHEDKGLEDSDKVWWSNSTCYLTSWYSQPTISAMTGMVTEEDEEWLYCHVCDYVVEYWDALKSGDDSYCWQCGSCFGCQQMKDKCLCYHKSEYEKVYDNRTYTEKYYGDRYGGWYL